MVVLNPELSELSSGVCPKQAKLKSMLMVALLATRGKQELAAFSEIARGDGF